MDATTRWKSSRAASRFDEQFDAATAAGKAEDADKLDEDGRVDRYEGVVVGISRLSSPEASVDAVDVVEGADDAVDVNEGVGSG